MSDMQFGDLTNTEIEELKLACAGKMRQPSFAVWIEGLGGVSDYVVSIDSEVALESAKGRGKINIGSATVELENVGGYFYYDGESRINRNEKIQVWCGFSGLNIPIFAGVVYSVKPRGDTGVVDLACKDYMGVLSEMWLSGSQDPNNTIKLLCGMICEDASLLEPDIESTDETTAPLTDPTFDERTYLRALEEICSSIFYAGYFNEEGVLMLREREHSNQVDFVFKDRNTSDCFALEDTEIINDLTIEYRENFYTKSTDQTSIDTYRSRMRVDRNLLTNESLVSSKYIGSTTEELDYDLEGFKFQAGEDSGVIDCLHIKMKQDGAHGYIYAKIYSDSGGNPNTLLGTSQQKASANLSESFAWEIFYFVAPVDITPSGYYWIIIDITSVDTGSVYVQISAAVATAKHTHYDSGWVAEDNKQVLHEIRGSVPGQRTAGDVVRFYKEPHERIRIIAPAVPQLQLMDEVLVDVRLRGIKGRYIIEGRRHMMKPDSYTTIDTLRKVR